jgi:hypothetical protein
MRGTEVRGRRRLLLGLLPILAVGALIAAPFASASGPTAGVISATAEFLPAPSADQMMMPMEPGMQHDDELQVVLQLRNDTDEVKTVPFDRIALLGSGGKRVEATGGLVGDLVMRPHAGAEERLRFPAQDSQTVHLSVPGQNGDRVLDLPLSGGAALTPSHHH